MHFRQLKIIFSLLLFLIIAISAWPAYVAASLSVSFFMDALGVQDFLEFRPKRLWLAEFLSGWKSSAPLAAGLGLLAVIDMQILTRQRYTYIIAGITLPLALMGLGMFFFQSQGLEMLPAFAGAGIILWLIYRVTELVSRFERS